MSAAATVSVSPLGISSTNPDRCSQPHKCSFAKGSVKRALAGRLALLSSVGPHLNFPGAQVLSVKTSGQWKYTTAFVLPLVFYVVFLLTNLFEADTVYSATSWLSAAITALWCTVCLGCPKNIFLSS